MVTALGIHHYPSWTRRGVATLVAAVLVGVALLAFSPPAGAVPDFVVNSTIDATDANPGDGACAADDGTCTLRAAIQEANALLGRQTIEVAAGVYTLAIAPFEDDLAASGDLDITEAVTIIGAGQAATIIDGGVPAAGSPLEQLALDRLFEIHQAAGAVTISNLTVQNGYHAETGGAIANSSLGAVRLENIAVLGSDATTAGGGIYSGESLSLECPEPCGGGSPRLDLINATISDNVAGGEGGGVYVQFGTLTVSGGTISGNSAGAGAGVFNAGELGGTGLPSRANLTGVTISGNVALGAGGGIFGDHEGAITLSGVALTGNTAFDYGGGVAVVSKASLSITGGSVSDNIAGGEGGGAYTGVEGSVAISGVTFANNAAGRTLPSVEVPARSPRAKGAAAASTPAAAARSASPAPPSPATPPSPRAAASSSATTARSRSVTPRSVTTIPTPVVGASRTPA